jgi:two-component system chemotaxis response regulator CheB
MIRVLLVDDSPSVRAVLRRFLRRTGDLEVAAEAPDGAQAVQAVLDHEPQVVVMDLQMPVMDGYAAIERIMELRPTPIVVLTSRANRNEMRTAFEAMRRGALEVLPKPEDTESWRHLADTLPDTLRAVAGVGPAPEIRPPRRRSRTPARRRSLPLPEKRPDLRWIGVGASTGGPAAMRDLLEALPNPLPVTVLLVQHIAPGFEVGLADWLSRELDLDVRVARPGERPNPGAVRMAPAGYHLHLVPGGRLELDSISPPVQGHRPAVDELFFSLADGDSMRSAGVLLTGMGSDGVEGLLELRRQGGLTFAQDEATSVVYGMPRVALEREAVDMGLSLEEIARTLARTWQEGSDT